jgi:hypothetical protein
MGGGTDQCTVNSVSKRISVQLFTV